MSSHIRTEFCMRTASSSSGVRWPAGSYCILKKGECPRGNYTPILFRVIGFLTFGMCFIENMALSGQNEERGLPLM